MRRLLSLAALCALAACTQTQSMLINPQNWPQQASPIERDVAMEERIDDLLQRMTMREKVGQIIQPDISAVTPADVRDYDLGSVLNGGSSAPGGDNRTSADQWLALADAFWEASTDTSDGGVGIPLIWGTDAVHGHNNIVGATLFPHNIALGMANDPELMFKVGRVTAIEMLVTGLDWTFAPTLAVARNTRWGRTYESYSENPVIIARYAPQIIEGLQGKVGSDEFLDEDHLIATAKHFAGDGGTTDGRDQGNTDVSEAELRDVQAAGYMPAIQAGVQTVMASYSGYHGTKIHGYKELLDDVLVGRMGFDGFTVGDWNGHGQVDTCTNTRCAVSLNAGLDMYMAPDSWKGLFHSTIEQVEFGEISMARLDEAVARVLRVKMRAGIFESPRPSARKYGGRYELLGSQAHRNIAREAVRKSLVLLKNENALLPLSPDMNILLAGDGANNIGKQSGGWTLNWQGSGNRNAHFPNGESILDGFVAAVGSAAGTVTYSEDGSYDAPPDVAVVVFGEDPYAEFQGDRLNVNFDSADGLRLLRRFQSVGIPTVSIFLSGRPLWVNAELNASDAFVAAWLPGTEGGGIADVVVADFQGQARHDFTGRLSFSWPKLASQAELNFGDADYDPLFAFGYGLSYENSGTVLNLSEESGLDELNALPIGTFVAFGDPVGQWGMELRDAAGTTRVTDSLGASANNYVSVRPVDRNVQEEATELTWHGAAIFAITGLPTDFTRESNGEMTIELDYQVVAAAGAEVALEVADSRGNRGRIDISNTIARQAGKSWQTSRVRLSCFADQGVEMAGISEPLVIQGSAGLKLQLVSARLAANPGDASCEL